MELGARSYWTLSKPVTSRAGLPLTASLKAHGLRRKLDFTYKAKTGNRWREVGEKDKAERDGRFDCHVLGHLLRSLSRMLEDQ